MQKKFPWSWGALNKGLTACPPAIFWYRSIACFPNFAKKACEIFYSYQYCDWLDVECEAGQLEVALTLKMENPEKGNDDDSNDNTCNELNADNWDTIKIHMKKIYVKNLVNTKYDQNNPVFIEPANPNCYILLTLDAFSQWVKALPPEPKRVRLSNNPDQHGNTSSLKKQNLRFLADLVAWRCLSPQSDIEDYLEFLGIHNKAQTLEILLEDGFHSHKVFKSPGLSQSDVKALGITLGVVTLLFENVLKSNMSIACD
ncbi:hypothetical protein VP01_2710g4 [Puccinia sorghi]|uniref:Uncharacterized protein n=1 Tax=Puccinia sorghi TaxID=27349 RepID=A0A0L6V3J5_9BASI|nr:hypothetical protein VP01_2710g4 [Puccinia sorghi]